MPRRTKKYMAGVRILTELQNAVPIQYSNDELYNVLKIRGLVWDHKAGEWIKRNSNEPITGDSIFATMDGAPSGVVKVRVMAHPKQVSDAVKALRLCPNLRVIEVSDKTYPNRRGIGERVYITMLLDGDVS